MRRGVVVNLRHNSNGNSNNDDDSNAQLQHPEHPSRTRRRIRDASSRHRTIISHYNPQYQPHQPHQGLQQQSQSLVRIIQPRPPSLSYGGVFDHPQPSSAGHSYSDNRPFDYPPPYLRDPRTMPSLQRFGSVGEDPHHYESRSRQQDLSETGSNSGEWHQYYSRGGIPQFQQRHATIAQREERFSTSDDMFRVLPLKDPQFFHSQPPQFASLPPNQQQRKTQQQRSDSWLAHARPENSFETFSSASQQDSSNVRQSDGRFEICRQYRPESRNSRGAGLNLPPRDVHAQSLSFNGDDVLSRNDVQHFDSSVEPPIASIDDERREWDMMKLYQPSYPHQQQDSTESAARKKRSFPFSAQNRLSDLNHQSMPPSVRSPEHDLPLSNWPNVRAKFEADRPSHPRHVHHDQSVAAVRLPPPFFLDRSTTRHERTSPLGFSVAYHTDGLDRNLAIRPAIVDSQKGMGSDDGNDPNYQDSLCLTWKQATGATEDQAAWPETLPAVVGRPPFGKATKATIDTVKERKNHPTRQDQDGSADNNQVSKPLVANSLFYAELGSAKTRTDIFHTTCARPVLGVSSGICFFNEERRVDWHNRPLPSPMVHPSPASQRKERQRRAGHNTFFSGALDGSDDDDLDLSGEKSLWR